MGVEKGREAIMKPVLCYDAQGMFLKEFESSEAASKYFNLSRGCVYDSVKLGSWVREKYYFRFKEDDNIPTKIDVPPVTKRNAKRPVLFLSEYFEVMAEYPSALEASLELEVPKTTINRAAQYNYLVPTRTGHIFIYKDLYEEIFEEVA